MEVCPSCSALLALVVNQAAVLSATSFQTSLTYYGVQVPVCVITGGVLCHPELWHKAVRADDVIQPLRPEALVEGDDDLGGGKQGSSKEVG